MKTSDVRRVASDGSDVARAVPSRHLSPVTGLVTGFTLMELMMVVAIIGLMTAIGVPAFLSMTREAPLRKAVNDVMEICTRARAQAILTGTTTLVVFHPRQKEMSFNGNARTSGPVGTITRLGRQKAVNETTFDPHVTIEGLGINNFDYTESEEGRVQFFSNGTSDEMTLVLSSNGEYRKITLEVTTALASVSDVK